MLDSQGKRDYNAAIPTLDAWSKAWKNKDPTKKYKDRIRRRFDDWSETPNHAKRIVYFLDAASYDPKIPLAVYIDLLHMAMEPLFRAGDHRCLDALLKLCLDLPKPFDCLWAFFDARVFVVGHEWNEGEDNDMDGDREYVPSRRAISQMVRLACDENNDQLAENLILQLLSPYSFEYNYLVSHFTAQGNYGIISHALGRPSQVHPAEHLARWAALIAHPDVQGKSPTARLKQLEELFEYCQRVNMQIPGTEVLEAVIRAQLNQGLHLLHQYRDTLDFKQTSVADLFVRQRPDVATARIILDLVRPGREQLQRDKHRLMRIRDLRASSDRSLLSDLFSVLTDYEQNMPDEQRQQQQQQILPQQHVHAYASDPYAPDQRQDHDTTHIHAGDRKEDYGLAELFGSSNLPRDEYADIPPLEREA